MNTIESHLNYKTSPETSGNDIMRALLSGMRLADMADLNQRRISAIHMVFATAMLFLFSLFGAVNFIAEQSDAAFLNFFCAFLSIVNLRELKNGQEVRYPTKWLTLALLIEITKDIFLLGTSDTVAFWIFPAIAAVIHLNKFKAGLLITIYCCSISVVGLVMGNSGPEIGFNKLIDNRIFISFVATCAVCLISNYYFNKTLNYIQELYNSGIQELAYKDKLTGLANRWSFESWANKTLEEERYSKNITALIFLDIDNFKQINDNYGHDIGDKLLQDFAKRLSNNIRHINRKTNEYEFSIARYAGDEFMLLLHDVPDMQALENIVQRINALFSCDFVEEDMIEPLTFSIGVAVYRKDADKLEDLIRCADRAMYCAKREGKNRYQFYQPEITNPVEKLNVAKDAPRKLRLV